MFFRIFRRNLKMANAEKKIRLLKKINIEKMVEEEISVVINNKFKEDAKRIDCVTKNFNKINNLRKRLILKYEKVIQNKISEIRGINLI